MYRLDCVRVIATDREEDVSERLNQELVDCSIPIDTVINITHDGDMYTAWFKTPVPLMPKNKREDRG